MTEYRTENKLGVGEILICNTDTNGKLEPLKYFIGKVIINIGGGGEKIYVIEERDKISSEVKSIQSRSNFKKAAMTTDPKLKNHKISVAHSLRDGEMEHMDMNQMSNQEDQGEMEEAKVTGTSLKKVKSGLLSKTDEFGEGRATMNLDMHDIHEVDENRENHDGDEMGEVLGNMEGELEKQATQRSLLTTRKRESELTQRESLKNDDVKADISLHKQESNFSKKLSNLENNVINENESPQSHVRQSNRFDTQIQNGDNNENNNINMNTGGMGSEISNNTKYTEFGGSKNIGFVEKEQQIIQIVKGKYHLLKLTMDGKVYGSGESYFGVVGLGGAKSADKPTLIPNLAKLKIVQIACGMFHSLALSQAGDLYCWGMGFEGQLGLSSQYKVASSPRYLNFFYKKPVKFIACGHNYSLCITNDSRLWGWGENKLGQLGLGKIQIVDRPTHIELFDLPGNQEGCNKADSFIGSTFDRPYTSKPLSACYVSAGFAHTAVVTDEGFLLTFGLNIYGQLGLGNTVSTFEPRLIEKDDNGDYIGKIVKVSCNVNGTFIITDEGKLYTCGSKEIGHGIIGVIKLPKLIGDSRVYQHIFCNDNSVIAFCPLRILSISPACGPASGNTILSIIGSALKEFPKLSVRFIFEGVARDVKATFDKISRTIFVRTPNFLELCPSMELPAHCKVQLTFDGHYFTEYKDSFLIYPSTIKLAGIEPKCGPTIGGSLLQVKINLDSLNPKYLFSLTCGFQAKPIVLETVVNKKQKTKRFSSNNNSSGNVNKTHDTIEESKISFDERSNMGTVSHGKDNNTSTNTQNINPMDFANIESQLDKANWYCCFATYENGVMTCSIPRIDNFSQNQVEYNVDVAINGQQFTGFPMIYRFYDIKIEKMEPNISSLDGGLLMKIYGTGLFDSVTKKARITSQLGERYTDLQWDRNDKTLILVSNPLLWITNDEDVIRNIPASDLYENYTFNVQITMNNIEWIPSGSYRYCDPKITRVIYQIFPETMSKDDRLFNLSQPESLTNEEKVILGIANYPEEKKKKDEIEKKRNEEDNIISNVYKRPYNGLILYGNFFPNTQLLKVKLVAQTCEVEVIAFYKNRYKIACLIPEILKLAVGQYELKVMVSVNSQNYFPANKTILFNSPEYGLKFEDIVKLDELESKGKKIGAKPTGGVKK